MKIISLEKRIKKILDKKEVRKFAVVSHNSKGEFYRDWSGGTSKAKLLTIPELLEVYKTHDVINIIHISGMTPEQRNNCPEWECTAEGLTTYSNYIKSCNFPDTYDPPVDYTL